MEDEWIRQISKLYKSYMVIRIKSRCLRTKEDIAPILVAQG